jgi:hypothetical protein
MHGDRAREGAFRGATRRAPEPPPRPTAAAHQDHAGAEEVVQVDDAGRPARAVGEDEGDVIECRSMHRHRLRREGRRRESSSATSS